MLSRFAIAANLNIDPRCMSFLSAARSCLRGHNTGVPEETMVPMSVCPASIRDAARAGPQHPLAASLSFDAIQRVLYRNDRLHHAIEIVTSNHYCPVNS